MAMERLKPLARIYYGGDRANEAGFGVVLRVRDNEWGLQYDIQMDDGRIMNGIHHCMFSEKYLGHGGTRFVTGEAYEEWRKNQMAQFARQFPGLAGASNV